MNAAMDANAPEARRRSRRVVGVLAALLASGGAVAAALATGAATGPVMGRVEGAVQAIGTLLDAAATALPLGYAVGAGMVAAVNPCGVALLPAYLGLYLRQPDAADAPPSLPRRLAYAVWISAAVSAGFVVLFGAAGLLVGAAATALARVLPWAGLAVGLLLVATGGWLLAGGALASGLAGRAADRLGVGARRASGRGFFAFGLTYGLASLGCTLPIFLTVVGSALATEGLLAAAGQLVLYALGMGGVVTALTLSAVVAESALLAWARRVGRALHLISSLLVLLAGAYLIYYWLALGGLLAGLGAR